jgi:uncharacterized membrane protein YvbJ
MFCTECGNKIKEGDKFCNHCGATSGDKPNNVTSTKAVKNSGETTKKLLKICLWIALIIGGIWLIIALGPLWIIAIILLLILLVVANR